VAVSVAGSDGLRVENTKAGRIDRALKHSLADKCAKEEIAEELRTEHVEAVECAVAVDGSQNED